MSPSPTAPVEADSAGDLRAEYGAAREATALFDLTGRTQIELTGRDRAKFLHNFCTNDIRGLLPGNACEAFLTSVQGKVLAYLSVSATAEALWLTSVPGCAERIIAHLSRYQISEEVTFRDRTYELATLLIAGPRAPQVAAALVPAAESLKTLQLVEATIHGVPVQARRHDFLRLPGFILVSPRSAADVVRERLLAAGARPAGTAAFEALRIEACFPLYGVDISDGNLAQEVGRTAQAISFTKGCYLGQEPIARIDALGHVNQLLRGLKLAGSRPPPPGAEVWTTTGEAKKAGVVTSAATSGADGLPVALAYLRRHCDTPGLALEVRFDNSRVPAVVYE